MPKVKLTAEEKKRLRREKKLAKKQEQIRLKRQQEHDNLSRQIKWGQLTMKLHEKNWKKLLTKLTLPKMREELQFAWHNFERVIDAKDFCISLYMDDLEGAEEQYMKNIKNHAERIDNFINFFKESVKELNDDFNKTLINMQDDAEKTLNLLNSNQEELEFHLKTMLHGLEQKRRDYEKDIRGYYISRADEEKVAYLDHFNNMKLDSEISFNRILKSLEVFHRNYFNETKERRMNYEYIKSQDISVKQKNKQQLKKIHKMIHLVKVLKLKFNDLQETKKKELYLLKYERSYFAEFFEQFKKVMILSDRKYLNQLTDLTKNSNETLDYINKLLKRGENILQLITVCRKLETEEEKVLCFPNSQPCDVKIKDIFLKQIKYKVLLKELSYFYQKIGEADTTRVELEIEREYLHQENIFLREKLHGYCLCLNCPKFILPPIKMKKTSNIHITDCYYISKNYKKCGLPLK